MHVPTQRLTVNARTGISFKKKQSDTTTPCTGNNRALIHVYKVRHTVTMIAGSCELHVFYSSS